MYSYPQRAPRVQLPQKVSLHSAMALGRESHTAVLFCAYAPLSTGGWSFKQASGPGSDPSAEGGVQAGKQGALRFCICAPRSDSPAVAFTRGEFASGIRRLAHAGKSCGDASL